MIAFLHISTPSPSQRHRSFSLLPPNSHANHDSADDQRHRPQRPGRDDGNLLLVQPWPTDNPKLVRKVICGRPGQPLALFRWTNRHSVDVEFVDSAKRVSASAAKRQT